MNHKINKLLIANRTEIALRIKKAADSLGIQVVGLASIPDEVQSYALEFKELAILDGNSATDSYLSIHKIIAVALKHGCNAVHPGYGFLSENADFARAVEDAGLIFVGPTSKTIQQLGSKTEARALATRLRVPIVSGTKGNVGDKELISAAKKMKLPILIKAVAGGGGRGMRVVRNFKDLGEELVRARAEAKKFFSDDAVFIEQYVENPRHVEVQLFGDRTGRVITFGTRDCSAQRRYQKVIEEAPAPFLSPALRKQIETAAIKIAKAAKYVGAGTAEFIVKGKNFYFLEINTRIQVEHPVTEESYGVDLIKLQLLVAQGMPIPKEYRDKTAEKYAVEIRVYAESSDTFAPSIGKIEALELPIAAEDVRFDFGYLRGDRVLPYYDAMIGKVIVIGTKRLATLDRAREILDQIHIEGIETNIVFAKKILGDARFRKGTLSIQSIDLDLQKGALQENNEQRSDGEAKTFQLQEKNLASKITYVGKKSGTTFSVSIEYKAPYFIATPMIDGKKPNSPELYRRSRHPEVAVSALSGEVLDTLTKTDVARFFT